MRKKVVYVTNIPAPYSEKVHEFASEKMQGDYHVVYAHTIEPDRLWDVRAGSYSRSFLKKCFINWRGRYIHINFDIWGELNRLDPEVVITIGFNPTFLLAFLWCRLRGRKHISSIDGWLKSEADLTFIHFMVRRIVFRRSDAFIGASRHSLDLFRHYGCDDAALFESRLCVDNDSYRRKADAAKHYDLLFSGQIIDRKMPLFFSEVARILKKKKPDLRVLILGDGPLREDFLKALEDAGVNHHYAGFVKQDDLPSHYASARLLLFPTRQDPWGVVANEACAAGVPVITCDNAGAAHDLVLHDHNGYVLDLDAEKWSDAIFRLLSDSVLWKRFSRNALQQVKANNFLDAAEGIVEAVAFAQGKDRKAGPFAADPAFRENSASGDGILVNQAAD